MVRQNRFGIVDLDPVGDGPAFDVRISLADEARCEIGLALANLTGGIKRLPLKIAKLDPVVVDDGEVSSASTRQGRIAPAPIPPAPTIATLAAFSLSCPAPPTCGRTMCRA